MKTFQKALKYNLDNLVPWIALFLIGCAAFLVVNKATAGSQNTPTAIVGYESQNISGDVLAELKSVQVHPNNVQVELCLEMPTLDPWNPYATLTVDGLVIPNSEVALLDAKNPKVMETPHRCYRFTFPLLTHSLSGKGVLKLEKLWLELGRGQFTDEVVAQIKARLQKVAPGADFEIVKVAEKGGGGALIKITSKPQGMSEDEIVNLIQQLSIDEVATNWEVEISLK